MTMQFIGMPLLKNCVFYGHLSIIELERGGFGEILPSVMPSGNIITEGNISPNPPSGRSIIDILYRKFKQGWMLLKGKQVHDFGLNGGCNL
jgi:hypothetical protein